MLSAVETSYTTFIVSVLAWSLSSASIHTCMRVLCIVAAATICGGSAYSKKYGNI